MALMAHLDGLPKVERAGIDSLPETTIKSPLKSSVSLILTSLDEYDTNCIMMDSIINMNHLYKPAEAAQLIGIGYATIYRWIKAGKLIPVKIAGHTLIPKNEIDRLKRNRRKNDD